MMRGWLAVLCAMGLAMLALVQPVRLEAQQLHHTIHVPERLEWQDGPPALAPGTKVVILRGDPTKPGIFTMRLKFPKGYIMAPHWHTADEHVTVVSGALLIGIGEKYDGEKVERVNPGSLLVMPATHRHFARFDQETVLQLHGMGPWVVNYVNPADDPRRGGSSGNQ